jgi:hypothetical protein
VENHKLQSNGQKKKKQDDSSKDVIAWKCNNHPKNTERKAE